MFLHAFRQLNIKGAVLKSTKATNHIKLVKLHTPELASLPPAPHLRSLQYKGAKRGTIKPILNHEPIKPGALVDPTHPVFDDKSFRPPAVGNEYFDAKVYPNVMLKRLGVVFMPNGKLRPRPPKEPDLPVLKNKKRVKFASAFILVIKKTHKSDVVRTRLKRKILEAIRLVVTRGANVDPDGKLVAFDESEAGEAKWVLRDWYYLIHPKPPVYHASWPDLIRATRDTLSKIVQKGAEWTSTWKIQIAEREGAAMARLARREMRRVRMWRRQDQEALARGQIAEDVGIRWKKKGMGVKKRRIDKSRPGVRTGKVKSLRAPSRKDFREGRLSARESSAKPALARSTERRGKEVELETDSSRHGSRPPGAQSARLYNPRVPASVGTSRTRTDPPQLTGQNHSKSIHLPKGEVTSSSSKVPSTKPSSLREPLASKATRQQKSVARVRKQEE